MVRDFRNQVAPVYCRFPQSRRTCNQFQLRACNMYPPKFLYEFSLFQRMVFVAIGGAVAPPLGYATAEKNLLDHVQYLSLVILLLYYTI